MTEPITDLAVSLNKAEEKNLLEQGFTKIDVDLNKGAGGKYIFLWYKKQSGTAPITNIQFTFNKDMTTGLVSAGYTKIDKDLNSGAGGAYIYLWHYQGTGEFHTPIVDISITTGDGPNVAKKYDFGWERLTVNLNSVGESIHVWLKREKQTVISDVTATDAYSLDYDLFTSGYIRVDENLHSGIVGDPLFIWYRLTTGLTKAVNGLQVSTSEHESQVIQQEGYTMVNVNLNKGTGGSKVYLWFKKGFNNPIKSIVLLRTSVFEAYQKASVTVIERNLNTGNAGQKLYLGYLQK